MPTVTVDREELFSRLGWRCSDEEFDEKCFEFGVELDDVQVEPKRTLYHIAIAANRIDLLCTEGLARALKCFFSGAPPPVR
jgi:phenylalanyl-tRNA synthetase beta chain